MAVGSPEYVRPVHGNGVFVWYEFREEQKSVMRNEVICAVVWVNTTALHADENRLKLCRPPGRTTNQWKK